MTSNYKVDGKLFRFRLLPECKQELGSGACRGVNELKHTGAGSPKVWKTWLVRWDFILWVGAGSHRCVGM